MGSIFFYFIVNLFRTYVLYRFIEQFFKGNGYNTVLKVVGFALYYIIVSSLYLAFDRPVINLCANLLTLFAVTYVYRGRLWIRFITVFLVTTISMLLETIIYTVIKNIYDGINSDEIVLIVVNLVNFAIVLLIERIFGETRMRRTGIVNGIAFFVIPVCSIVLVVNAYLEEYSQISTLVMVGLLLGINVMVVYLYDALTKAYETKYMNEILMHQNKAYRNEFEIIEEVQKSIRSVRHDMKNHIVVMRELLANEKYKELNEYMDKITDSVTIDREYAKTGHAELDSIINYKLGEAGKQGAKIKLRMMLPDRLNISLFDLNVILGNLLDNAVEALAKCKEEKLLDLSVEWVRGTIRISVVNTFNGIVNIDGNKLVTTKKESANHGMGLVNVQHIVEKYHGFMRYYSADKMFYMTILMYE